MRSIEHNFHLKSGKSFLKLKVEKINIELTTASCMKMHDGVFFVPSSNGNGG